MGQIRHEMGKHFIHACYACSANASEALQKIKTASIEEFERIIAEPVIIELCSERGRIVNFEEFFSAFQKGGFDKSLVLK